VALEALFCAVVDARDAWHRKEEQEPQFDLTDELRSARVPESLRLVVVVQKGALPGFGWV
jgi:hypothetical protein